MLQYQSILFISRPRKVFVNPQEFRIKSKYKYHWGEVRKATALECEFAQQKFNKCPSSCSFTKLILENNK